MIDWHGVIAFSFVLLSFLSVIIGYPICLWLIGPRILEANGIRRKRESMLYFGNIVLIEHDLKQLASRPVGSAIRLLRIVNVCKWSIVVNISLLAIYSAFFI